VVAVPVDQADARASRHDDRRLGEREPVEPVVVAAHGHHRGDPCQVVQHRHDAEVAGVEDQVAALECLEHGLGEDVEVLADVRVGDHPDARQLRYRRASAARATPRSIRRDTRSG